MKRKTTSEAKTLANLTQTSAAKLIGVSRQTLSGSDAPRLPDGGYAAVRLVRWFVDRRVTAAAPDPMLLASGDSQSLERYRAARADLARLDVQERCGEVVRVSVMRTTLGRWAAILRDAGGELGRLHGHGAQGILTEALADCRAIVKSELGQPEGQTDGHADQQTD